MRDIRLVPAAGLFVIGNAIHSADHVRRGWARPLLGETPEILVGGILISLGALLVLGMALRGSDRAGFAAAAVGLASAVGIAAAHVAPPWGVLSDSYLVLRPDLVAWMAVLIEITTAALLAAAGLMVVLRGRAGRPLVLG
jgi:hypothetical protein